MKYSYKLFIAIVIFFSGCKKHDYYQQNPNEPSVGTAPLLLTSILQSIFNISPIGSSYADRHVTYYQGNAGDSYVIYNWTTGSFGSYDILRQVKDMDDKAAKTGEENYRGLAKFFRAVCFTDLTEQFGDIPYSEAMKALEGIPTPKYDLQKDVYKGILNELEEANNILDPAKGTVAGDIIYGGKIQQILQWKKLVNAYRLRLLIHLSKKEADPDLNIKQQFQAIISNPSKYPLMTNIADNGQIVYNNSDKKNNYPITALNVATSWQSDISLEKGFVNILKDRNDPRLFSFAEPVSGQPAGVITSYAGVDAGLSNNAQRAASTAASRIKTRYTTNPINEPMIFLSYAEQEFLIAEAISRSWITGAGTAKSHYDNGITASMAFYSITGAAVTSYLSQPIVAFDPANAIPLIITQKHISFFMNSGWEAFYDNRRTKVITYGVGPATLNGGQVPKRWRYPSKELTLNAANVNAAIQRQYTTDNINGIMWLLQ